MGWHYSIRGRFFRTFPFLFVFPGMVFNDSFGILGDDQFFVSGNNQGSDSGIVGGNIQFFAYGRFVFLFINFNAHKFQVGAGQGSDIG